jgi:hypothetical protein
MPPSSISPEILRGLVDTDMQDADAREALRSIKALMLARHSIEPPLIVCYICSATSLG